MNALLLITATSMEGKPLRDALDDVETLEFPLGELYRGRLSVQTIYLAHLGIAKVNTAAGLALIVAQVNPGAVIQFGIGGAFGGSGLRIGDVAVASSEIHLDTGVRDQSGWQDMKALGFSLVKRDQAYYNVLPTAPELSTRLARITAATTGPFGTSETVTGTVGEASRLYREHRIIVESMEGAAAAQVCLALDLPFAEIRGVSNLVGERDKRHWDIRRAVERVNDALLGFLNRP